MWLVLAASSLTPPRAWRLPPSALRAGSAAVCEADGGGGGGEQNARSIPPPLPASTDPFVLLGLDHSSAGDIAAIKSAYHRLTKARLLVTASTPVRLRQRIHDDFSRAMAVRRAERAEGRHEALRAVQDAVAAEVAGLRAELAAAKEEVRQAAEARAAHEASRTALREEHAALLAEHAAQEEELNRPWYQQDPRPDRRIGRRRGG
ncbi:Hypothetical protein EMIHUDRAFT_454877 [Emiliania huxleyi CCMP1516]|uniref:J domain-containing protein n=2 Tax=Emiliania huxleyi TaxID=2903 RepID=A0A0D3KP50_EMIH1|nr:Hypothetical protein EMIHUDRAFT_454877 [Emiliania huxleyi CCMP1516]EOD37535.1 Hypothetical protein EMIHUDRAFT_454877 [Emiliania huxleyi CCMP1516]|eukprot:XP_005789964.1 Hypothetical protein EMIHUDRAFT_454877 [Emiliania huxleyi CCMP1516]